MTPEEIEVARRLLQSNPNRFSSGLLGRGPLPLPIPQLIPPPPDAPTTPPNLTPFRPDSVVEQPRAPNVASPQTTEERHHIQEGWREFLPPPYHAGQAFGRYFRPRDELGRPQTGRGDVSDLLMGMGLLGASVGGTILAPRMPLTRAPRATTREIARTPRAISEAASETINNSVIIVNGRTFRGRTHLNAMENASRELNVPVDEIVNRISGTRDYGLFETSRGRIVNREEAGRIAGQRGDLHSEDLPGRQQPIRREFPATPPNVTPITPRNVPGITRGRIDTTVLPPNNTNNIIQNLLPQGPRDELLYGNALFRQQMERAIARVRRERLQDHPFQVIEGGPAGRTVDLIDQEFKYYNDTMRSIGQPTITKDEYLRLRTFYDSEVPGDRGFADIRRPNLLQDVTPSIRTRHAGLRDPQSTFMPGGPSRFARPFGPSTVIRSASSQDAAVSSIVKWLKDSNTPPPKIETSKSTGTKYIRVTDTHSGAPITIRVPRDGHIGVIKPDALTTKMGNLFDTGSFSHPGRVVPVDPRFTRNVSGDAYSNLDNLFDALSHRLSKSPSGQFLVAPGREATYRGAARILREPKPIKPEDVTDPRQLSFKITNDPQLALPLVGGTAIRPRNIKKPKPERLYDAPGTLEQFGQGKFNLSARITPDMENLIIRELQNTVSGASDFTSLYTRIKYAIRDELGATLTNNQIKNYVNSIRSNVLGPPPTLSLKPKQFREVRNPAEGILFPGRTPFDRAAKPTDRFAPIERKPINTREILEMRRQGLTVDRIAGKLNVSPSVVYKTISSASDYVPLHGSASRARKVKNKYKDVNQEQINTIIRFHNIRSPMEISRLTGLSENVVREAIDLIKRAVVYHNGKN